MVEGQSAAWFTGALSRTGELVRRAAAAGVLAASAAAQLEPEFPLAVTKDPANAGLAGASIADWDGDGFGDLLFGHTTQVAWMRSRGDGSFEARVGLPGGAGFRGARWVDLDGDGRIDVVEDPDLPGPLRIAHQLPGGSLAAPVTLATNAQLARVHDFNGDGRLDLFVSITLNGAMSVRTLFNTPTGWQSSPLVPLGAAWSPTLGDFNGDGTYDLVHWKLGTSAELVLRLGTAQGTFGPDIATLTAPYFRRCAVVDLEGDGKDEYLCGLPAFVSVVRVVPGPSVTRSLLPDVSSLLAEPRDFDGDGDVDVLVLSSVGPTILRNDGAGGLAERLPTAVDPYFAHFAAGDTNGDGACEFVAGIGDRLAIALSDGNGGWSDAFPTPIPRNHVPVAVGDVDGDGLADFLGRRPNSSDWQVQRGLGNGGSVGLARLQLPAHVERCELIDVDGDGRLDAFGRADNAFELHVALNDGTGRFGPAVRTSGLFLEETFPGDFNGDGRLDLAVVGPTFGVRIGDGTGAFGPLVPSSSTYVSILAAGDFDGDGIDDVLEPGIAELRVRRGTPSGVFGPPILTPNPGSIPIGATVGDFNGDGALDAAWLEALAPSRIARAFGNGAGGFSPPVMTAIREGVSSPQLERVDLGPDTLDDLAILRVEASVATQNWVSLFESSPSGALVEFERIPCGDTAGHNALADLDGDGVAEVLLIPRPGVSRGTVLRRR